MKTLAKFNVREARRASPLRKRLRIPSVISGNYHFIPVLCPLNLLIRFNCYNTVKNKFKQL